MCGWSRSTSTEAKPGWSLHVWTRNVRWSSFSHKIRNPQWKPTAEGTWAFFLDRVDATKTCPNFGDALDRSGTSARAFGITSFGSLRISQGTKADDDDQDTRGTACSRRILPTS